MTCPRCSADVADGALDCPSCGIIFAKWRAPASPTSSEVEEARPVIHGLNAEWVMLKADPPPPPPPETLGVTHAGWKAAGIGLAMAGVLTFFPFLSFILSPLTTIVHEIGHTAVLWLFGYPAIPAFDFSGGGGVTLSDLERSPSAVWAWAIGLAALGWWQRENKKVLGALGAGVLIYFWMYNSVRETLAITLGGHAAEVLFAALFLYRGLTGWGCKMELERPLYAFLGFMILLTNLRLGMALSGNSMERYWYLQGKGGIDHDLVTGAQILSWRLESAARSLIALCVVAVPIAFVAASRRHVIGAISEAEEEV